MFIVTSIIYLFFNNNISDRAYLANTKLDC